MRVHILQHESFEAPGAYLKWAENKGYKVTFSKVFEGDKLPESTEGIDFLFVMGGPQSPATTLEECPHFDTKKEQEFIKKCIDAKKAVVGVCLGAQLIGESLGGKFDHSPEKEIGNFAIELTEEGLKDEKLSHFDRKREIVGHWHGDMPGLVEGSVVLAKSVGCPRQIIRFTPLVYGFQCHLEFDSEIVVELIANEKNLEQEFEKFRYIENPEEIKKYDYTAMNKKLYEFLDKLDIEYKNSL